MGQDAGPNSQLPQNLDILGIFLVQQCPELPLDSGGDFCQIRGRPRPGAQPLGSPTKGFAVWRAGDDGELSASRDAGGLVLDPCAT